MESYTWIGTKYLRNRNGQSYRSSHDDNRKKRIKKKVGGGVQGPIKTLYVDGATGRRYWV